MSESTWQWDLGRGHTECAVVGEPSTPVLSHVILMNVISNSDSSCRLIQHRVMFLMWPCEVIIVCDKIWVVDCVASLTRYRYLAFLCTHWFSLYMYILLTSSDAIAMLYPSGWTLKNIFLFTHKSSHRFHKV